MLNKKLVSERFHAALRKFITDSGGSAETVAKIVGRPVSTVYGWMDGSHSPHKAEIKNICAKFNWDYQALFSDDLLLEQIIHRDFLSFDALNSRYLSIADPFKALMMVSVAGTMAFHHFIKSGINVELKITHSSRVSLVLLDEAMGGLKARPTEEEKKKGPANLVIMGLKDQGILICLFAGDTVAGRWELLSGGGLSYYLELLRVYKEGGQSLPVAKQLAKV